MLQKNNNIIEHHCNLVPGLCSLFVIVVTMLAIATDTARAFPTVTVGRNVCFFASRPEAEPEPELLRLVDSELTELGREITSPVIVLAVSSDSDNHYAKTLPAVPAAVMMAVAGFFCISLVKDRRFWGSILAALLWIHNPVLRAAILPGKQPAPYGHTNQYIAIKSSKLYLSAGIQKNKAPFFLTRSAVFKTGCNALESSFLISADSSLIYIPQNCFPAFTGRYLVCFSPAFVFENLSRGPPYLA